MRANAVQASLEFVIKTIIFLLLLILRNDNNQQSPDLERNLIIKIFTNEIRSAGMYI